MEIVNDHTDETVSRELGRRLRRFRLGRNLGQSQLAEQAGVGRATLQRLEDGEAVNLTTLLRVLRALDQLGTLDLLLPEPAPSPLEELERRSGERQRAGAPRGRDQEEEPDSPWRWGDEE
jgi:transcriptional regulator with XRE-family HTH domain